MFFSLISMWRLFLFSVFCFHLLPGQNIVTRAAKVIDGEDYFFKLMTEAMLEVEDYGWSNLKCDNNTVTLNERMYNWMVTGNVKYTNGFLISIQKIGLDKIQASAFDTNAYVRGTLHFMDMKVGFDVTADLGDDGIHKYTGTFLHTNTAWTISITKDFETDKITTSCRISSLSGGLHKMIYMPADHITQVLSRKYTPGNIYDSVDQWGIDVIGPAMLKAADKIGFPEVCLSC